MLGFAKKFFGSSNERKVKAMSAQVARINALEPEYAALSDEALRAKTDEFKARLAKGESLDSLLPEAFAVVREAGKRVLGMCRRSRKPHPEPVEGRGFRCPRIRNARPGRPERAFCLGGVSRP